MKKLLLALTFCMQLFADDDDIAGFWKSINDDTKKIQCVFAVYPYEGKYYGRIVCTYDGEGKMQDDIYHPKEKAPGVPGNPPYCGLDLIWNLENSGVVYKGKILDPQKGNVYNSEVWVEAGNLIVRGKLLFFGRSVTWFPVTKADFPANFKMPDTAKFVPVIPQL